jgi:hypothetical protein
MIIEKVTGGYIVEHDGYKSIATADHVANFVLRYMKDVAERIEEIINDRRVIPTDEKPSPDGPSFP